MRVSLAAAGILACLASSCTAQDAPELSPGERELVALMTDYYAALEVYWRENDRFTSVEEYKAALADGTLVDPNAEYIPKLLEFEAKHRGDGLGIQALRHIFREAGRGGMDDAPTIVGRREAVGRLAAYAESPLLPAAARRSLQGNFEPAAYDAVKSLIESGAAPKPLRDRLRLSIASKDLDLQGFPRDKIAERIAELEGGAEPRWPGELERQKAWFEKVPPTDEMAQRVEAAVATLEELAADPDSPRLKTLKGVDERWYFVRVVDDPESQTLAETAAALLFKEQRLKVGKVAPDLEVTLLDDTPWRMVDQRGKVVVVQFSFTGCGPCARMYPDLADLTEEHAERLEVLTIMRDETAEDALAGVENGKLTWSVALDGNPGRVCRQWSVDGFPEVYVIGPDGVIAEIGVRGGDLREAIAELLAQQGSS